MEIKIHVPFLVMGFSLLNALTRKTISHLLRGWKTKNYTKKYLSVTIELFRHYCKRCPILLLMFADIHIVPIWQSPA